MSAHRPRSRAAHAHRHRHATATMLRTPAAGTSAPQRDAAQLLLRTLQLIGKASSIRDFSARLLGETYGVTFCSHETVRKHGRHVGDAFECDTLRVEVYARVEP